MDNTAQAEKIQHTLYLDKRRNWQWCSEEPFYESKVFFLKDGRVGMEYCGRVIVRSIELWMAEEQEEEIDFNVDLQPSRHFIATVTRREEPEPELYFEEENRSE